MCECIVLVNVERNYDGKVVPSVTFYECPVSSFGYFKRLRPGVPMSCSITVLIHLLVHFPCIITQADMSEDFSKH